MDEQKGQRRPVSKQQARHKIESYCAYQERSQKEVREKLYEFGLHSTDVEETISELIENNFLNEERFALAYAGGKFRIKAWGRKKIKMGLKLKGVPEKLIQKALYSIDDDAYLETLRQLLARKSALLPERESQKRRTKLVQYALGKGYEADLIFEALKSNEL